MKHYTLTSEPDRSVGTGKHLDSRIPRGQRTSYWIIHVIILIGIIWTVSLLYVISSGTNNAILFPWLSANVSLEELSASIILVLMALFFGLILIRTNNSHRHLPLGLNAVPTGLTSDRQPSRWRILSHYSCGDGGDFIRNIQLGVPKHASYLMKERQQMHSFLELTDRAKSMSHFQIGPR